MASDRGDPGPKAYAIPESAGMIAAVLFAASAAVICLLTARLSHDEEQYVAAAVLALRLHPIIDFAYLQTPLQPTLLAPLIAMAGSQAFVACRLVSGALGAAACILAYPIVRNSGGGRMLAALTVAWVASSIAVQEAMGSARNDALPLALALAGVALILPGQAAAATDRRPRVLTSGLAGILFGAALCAKLTYVFAPLGGLIYLMSALRRPKGVASLMAFLGGLIIGLLPLLYDFVQAPQALLFDVVEFHRRVTPDWYVRNGAEAQRSLGARLRFWLAAPLHDPVLLAAFGVLAWSVWTRRLKLTKHLAALALMVVLAAAAAFAVNPPTLAYLAAPSSLLILTAAVGWAWAKPRVRRVELIVAVLVLIACCVSDFQLARHALWLAKPAQWTPQRLDAQSRVLARLLAQAPSGPVATVSPIRIIGAGRAIYPEFAAGPFVFRSGLAIGPREAAIIKAATPDTLEALFARTPPAAILTGLETSWPIRADLALADYAHRHGFKAIPAPEGASLFVRPVGRVEPSGS